MKHSYILTDSIPEVKGTPNIRDLDGDVYIKIQGDSLHLGGYEKNPEILKEVSLEISFLDSISSFTFFIGESRLQLWSI